MSSGHEHGGSGQEQKTHSPNEKARNRGQKETEVTKILIVTFCLGIKVRLTQLGFLVLGVGPLYSDSW